MIKVQSNLKNNNSQENAKFRLKKDKKNIFTQKLTYLKCVQKYAFIHFKNCIAIVVVFSSC